MFKYLVFILLIAPIVSLASTDLLINHHVGFQQKDITLNGQESTLVFFYPTADNGKTALVADNQALQGVKVQPNASIAQGLHPLVVISHGYGGSWRNQSWLAYALAQQGYAVIATNHPGTSTHNMQLINRGLLGDRANDVTLLIDTILNSEAAKSIDSKNITAIGHSLGGATVSMIAGAEFSDEKFVQFCALHEGLADCDLYAKNQRQANDEKLWRDDRVSRIVSLDLGLAQGFTEQSLKAIKIPVLILAAGDNSKELPYTLQSAYLSKFIPGATLDVIADSTHFSFLQECKEGGSELIERYEPGEGIICLDNNGRSRAQLHAKIASDIIKFIGSATQ